MGLKGRSFALPRMAAGSLWRFSSSSFFGGDVSRQSASVQNVSGDLRKNMTVYKPRSRMISIRLSDEEYIGLKRLCVVRGARSVSDLARLAMSSMLVNED